jgi:hypothetical protein
MPVFVTQIEGDTMMLMEAETSGAFAKSDLEIRPNPMAAFDASLDALGRIGRVAAERLRQQYDGTGIESVELTFGIKTDGAGSVMIAQVNEAAQFTVKLSLRTG